MDASTSSHRRLRVLFYTNLFPTPVDPSFAIFNAQLARELAGQCDLTIVCPLPWFPRLRWLKRFRRWYAMASVPDEYEIVGLKVLSPKYPMLPRVSGAVQGWLMYFFTFRVVRRLHEVQHFDLINGLWLYPDAVAADRIASRLGIPQVPAALGCDVNRMLGEDDKRHQILRMLARSPAIIAVSAELGGRMVQEGIEPKRIHTVPNGVNASLFFPRDRVAMRGALGLDRDCPVILFVGRLAEEKGVMTLVAAAVLLKNAGRVFRLHVVGHGELYESIAAAIAAGGIADVVRLEGPRDHAAIGEWMGACNVFCLPSIREGCPNVVLEAIASGRPVVASAVGGIPSMVPESAGRLVPAGDAAALAAALEMALACDWDAGAIAATVRGSSWGGAAERYVSAYRAALD